MARARKDAQNERQALDAQMQSLRGARDQIRQQLARVHADVGQLLSGAAAANPEGAAAQGQPSQGGAASPEGKPEGDKDRVAGNRIERR